MLNKHFVSTWVLKPTVSALRDKAAGADTRRLAAVLFDARQKGSPVDCLVLTPELTVVAVRPFHDLLEGNEEGDLPARYRLFLTEAMKQAQK
jgi:hypothetical protein